MMRRRKPLFLIAGIVALALVLGVNLAYRAVLGELHESIDRELTDRLTGLAESFAATLEPQVVRDAFGSGDSFSPASYLYMWELGQAFAGANGLEAVAVIDTAWHDPFAAEGDSLTSVVRSILDQDGSWALEAGLPWVTGTYRWEGRLLRSVVAPILDSAGTGTVGLVRLDADARFFAILDRLETVGWWIHALSGLLVVALAALFTWYGQTVRRWESELLRSEKLIGLGRLAATIAHEIRNPLGIIKATAQRLDKLTAAEPPDVAKQRELLQFIPEEADRLNRILTGYLRIDTGAGSAPQPVDMAHHLPQWLARINSERNPDSSAPQLQVEATAPIWVDPDTPRQVLLNLLRNALDVASSPEKVRVHWEQVDEETGQLTVTDDGPGVARAQREKVFEPFYTTKTKGSGLGLYAVKMMVERDGGTIGIADNPGGGARFVVRWPLARRGNETE